MTKNIILECGHREWQLGRCATMSCENYVNKHRDLSKFEDPEELLRVDHITGEIG